MPVLLLVRHGQASFGSEDYDVLSETGRRQSEILGAELARRSLRLPVLATGSLRRQQETAAVALPGSASLVDPRFDEYDHLGLVEAYPAPGVNHDGSSRSFQVLLDHALRRWVADPDSSWTEFSEGAWTALREVVAMMDAGRDAVVVTSSGVIAAVCSRLLGAGVDAVVALNRVTTNGGITKLVAGRGGVSLVAFNDHAHFEDGASDLLTYR